MILIMKFRLFMFTLAICTILNGYTQVVIQNFTDTNLPCTCVSFSCEFNTDMEGWTHFLTQQYIYVETFC